MDKFIKEGLKDRVSSMNIEKTGECPAEAELIRYLEGTLPETKEKSLAEHVKGCFWCIEQLDQAQRAQSFYKGNKLAILNITDWAKKNKWLLGAGIAFVLSFVFSGYFLQFLILTLLMGIKWIFSTGGNKTVVMIYDAWKKKSRDDTHSRLHS